MIKIINNLKKSYARYSSELRRYCLLLLVPLALGLILYICVNAAMLRQAEKNGEYEVSRFSAEAHSMLNELGMVNDFTAGDEKLQQLVRSPKTSDSALELCRLVGEHASHSAFVQEIYLVCPSRGQICDTRSYYSYDSLDAILMRVIGEDSSILETEDYLGWHVLNANYASPYYFSKVPNSDALLLLSLNKTAFIRTLQNNSALISCMFNEEVCVSNLLINYPDTDWRDERQVSNVAGQRVKCFYLEQDGFTYLSALAMADYRAPQNMILLIFALYFALVLVVGLAYLNRVSKMRYDDVAEMICGLPHSPRENASFDEIVDELRRTMKEYKEDYSGRRRFERRNLLVQILTGGRSADQEMLQQLSLDRAVYGYYVGLFYFSDSPGISPTLPPRTNIDRSCAALQAILSETVEEYMDVSVTHLQHYYVAILSVRSEVVTDEDIRYVLYEAVGNIEAQYGSTITAFSSERITDSADFSTAYQNVVSLLGYTKSVSPDTSVLLQSDMGKDAAAFVRGDFIKQLQVISSTLLLGKYEMILPLVKATVEDHVIRTGSGFYLAPTRVTAIANLLAEVVASSSMSESEKNKNIRALQRVDSADDLIRLTETLIPTLSRSIPKDSGSDALGRACAYITKHLGDPNLSVPDVSEAAGVSVQHLARLFRSNLDTTVVERINSERINTAKRMLLETNLSINKIAEMVGYNNNVTFSRNFHRYVGMAPSEYRSLNSDK